MSMKDVCVDLHSVYVKNMVLSTADSRNFDYDKWQPDLEIEFGADYNLVDEDKDSYEVTLSFKIVAKCQKKFAFELKLCQAGMFILKETSDPESVDAFMGMECPSILFPFLRQTVADMVTKAGFPQFLLGMVNFRSFYEQRMEALKEMQSPRMCH